MLHTHLEAFHSSKRWNYFTGDELCCHMNLKTLLLHPHLNFKRLLRLCHLLPLLHVRGLILQCHQQQGTDVERTPLAVAYDDVTTVFHAQICVLKRDLYSSHVSDSSKCKYCHFLTGGVIKSCELVRPICFLNVFPLTKIMCVHIVGNKIC